MAGACSAPALQCRLLFACQVPDIRRSVSGLGHSTHGKQGYFFGEMLEESALHVQGSAESAANRHFFLPKKTQEARGS